MTDAATVEPVDLVGRATRRAEAVMAQATSEQLAGPTPCSEWTVGQAVAGTFMDQLIHTWDLATATGHDSTLDPELVAICSAMFLPDTPEMWRARGLVGPAVAVPADASPQAKLLGAMGRRP